MKRLKSEIQRLRCEKKKENEGAPEKRDKKPQNDERERCDLKMAVFDSEFGISKHAFCSPRNV